MSEQKVKKLLSNALLPSFEEKGYTLKKAQAEFIRKVDDGTKAIQIVLYRGKGEYSNYALRIKVRLEKIEGVYRKYLEDFNERARKATYTINIQYQRSFYFPDASIHTTVGDYNIDTAKRNILDVFEEQIRPFLRHHCTYQKIIENMVEFDLEKKIISDPDQRFYILLSHFALEQDSDSFEKYSSEYMDSFKSYKRKWKLEEGTALVEGIRKDYFS